MHKLYVKLQFRVYALLTLAYLVLGLGSSFLLYLLLPEQYFGFYPAIGIFYWLCGIALNFYLNRCQSSNPNKLVNVFMTVRMVKFVLTVTVFALAIKFIEVGRTPFVISLMAHYFLFSVIEIYIFHLYNKRRHKHDIAKKH